MPKKCESCRFYKNNYPEVSFLAGQCFNAAVADRNGRPTHPVEMISAREICNKEGDGIFVYFQPKSEPRVAVWKLIERITAADRQRKAERRIVTLD